MCDKCNKNEVFPETITFSSYSNATTIIIALNVVSLRKSIKFPPLVGWLIDPRIQCNAVHKIIFLCSSIQNETLYTSHSRNKITIIHMTDRNHIPTLHACRLVCRYIFMYNCEHLQFTVAQKLFEKIKLDSRNKYKKISYNIMATERC